MEIKRRKHKRIKIRLYAVRKLGDIINTSFDLIRENWRQWFKIMAAVLLPFAIVQGLMGDVIFGKFIIKGDYEYATWLTALAIMTLGFSAVFATTIELMRWYEAHDDGIDTLTYKDLWPRIIKTFAKCLVAVIILALLFSLPFIMAGGVGIIMLSIVLLCFALPFFLVAPVYVLEDVSLPRAIARALSLAKRKYAVLLVMGLILLLVTAIETCALSFLFSFLQDLIEAVIGSMGHVGKLSVILLGYVSIIVIWLMIYACAMISSVAFTLHYTSVATDVDNINIEADIDRFEEL